MNSKKTHYNYQLRRPWCSHSRTFQLVHQRNQSHKDSNWPWQEMQDRCCYHCLRESLQIRTSPVPALSALLVDRPARCPYHVELHMEKLPTTAKNIQSENGWNPLENLFLLAFCMQYYQYIYEDGLGARSRKWVI